MDTFAALLGTLCLCFLAGKFVCLISLFGLHPFGILQQPMGLCFLENVRKSLYFH
jgi:hypothetical protein